MRNFKRYTVLATANRDTWSSALIALAITLAVHIALLFLLPERLFVPQRPSDDEQDNTVELTLELPDPAEPDELRFVEANPEAPENEPDRKDTYSFRAQQAADQNPDESLLDAPNVEGEDTSQKIVQGSVEQIEPLPTGSGVLTLSTDSIEGPDKSSDDSQTSRPTPIPPPQPPPPAFIQQKPEVEDGPGSSLEISVEGQKAVEDPEPEAPINLYRVESPNLHDQATEEATEEATESKPVPRKRLTLPPDLIYGPLMRSEGSADRRGAIAIDATFNQFGEYQQQFLAAVQAGWYQEIDFFQPIDTSAKVVVRFRIRADGTVDQVNVLESTASEIATLICQTALTKRSPFRPWTVEMVQVFGQERTMEIAFLYR